MVQKGRIRNEWLDAYIESGTMPDEVPEPLRPLVLEAAEKRKGKAVEKLAKVIDIATKGKDELSIWKKL